MHGEGHHRDNILFGAVSLVEVVGHVRILEHYAYTQDKEYLRKVYRYLKRHVSSICPFLIENKDGYLVTSPSTSPENRFILSLMVVG